MVGIHRIKRRFSPNGPPNGFWAEGARRLTLDAFPPGTLRHSLGRPAKPTQQRETRGWTDFNDSGFPPVLADGRWDDSGQVNTLRILRSRLHLTTWRGQGGTEGSSDILH